MTEDFLYKQETHEITGLCIEAHGILGHGFLEIVYKDTIEWELNDRKIPYLREKEFTVLYKDALLRHNFYADFFLFDKIILEIKSVDGISKIG